jgi:hypothetical protein
MQYQNALTNPTYMPAVRDIAAITNAPQALVTTTFPHSYISGLIVRLIIPNNFGMTLINQSQGTITVTSDTQFTIDIDTTQVDPFVIPDVQPGNNYTAAQVTPIGEIAAILTGSFVNVLTPIV